MERICREEDFRCKKQIKREREEEDMHEKALTVKHKKIDQLKKTLICKRNSIKNDQERLDTRLFLVPERNGLTPMWAK